MSSFTSIEYSLEVINPKKTQYTLFTKLIILLNVLSIGYLAFTTPDGTIQKKLFAFGIFLPLISLLMERFFRKPHHSPYSLETIQFWFCVAWWQADHLIAASVNLTFLVLSLIANRELLVKIGSGGIRYPSFPAKRFPWTSLGQVILKDGILTIDKKDNTLIQLHVADASETNETDFNSYCQAQLKNG